MRTKRWFRRNARALTVGVLSGVALHFGLFFLPASIRTIPAVARAKQQLTCYGVSLSAFAATLRTFQAASFRDTAQLRDASRPLIPAIIAMNTAYTELSKSRLSLAVELRSTWPRSAARSELACSLEAVDRFQWKQVRPVLNAALVDVIAAWRHEADAALLTEVRNQQRTEWDDLWIILQTKGEALQQAFGRTCPSHSAAR